MKKILLTLSLLFGTLYAQSFLVSDIPLPKNYVMDVEPYECDDACMRDLLENERIFSFMAYANKKLPNKELDESRLINAAILNIGNTNISGKFQVALLLPYKKIGKYSTSTTNAVFAYLMTKNTPFVMKSYQIDDENISTIHHALTQIKNDGIEYIIAPLTKEGVKSILTLNPSQEIYFPTTNKTSVTTNSVYFTFGGIDYAAQSDLLLKEAISPLVIFSGTSQTGKELSSYQKEQFLHPKIENAEPSAFSSQHELPKDTTQEAEKPKKVYTYFISARTTNIENYLEDNDKIIGGSFMINTPVIKSGMIMSQLTRYDLNATNILSTQINYNPLILSMTQYQDRKNMFIANSITQKNNIQSEVNALIGNDIEYDWINYSTIIGVDYFYSKFTGEPRVYNLDIKANQVQYQIEIIQPMQTKFATYLPAQSAPLPVEKEITEESQNPEANLEQTEY